MRAFIARCASGDFWSSRAVGVPHIRTGASVSVTFECVEPPLLGLSLEVGVGQQPEPLPLVWCTSGRR
jgi:hypothetical protein